MNTGPDAPNATPPPGLVESPLPPGGSPSGGPIAIPDHELLCQIGKGSYGEVWLARHTMGMHRAVKIVYRASFHDQRPFERELSGIRKFEPISRSHEGFVDVLHVGLNPQAGYFYYVMEVGDDVVAGQAIDPATYSPKTLGTEITQRGKLSLAGCVQCGLALSQALADLHQHGLVHRDIKPSNVVFVNGRPKLADIGLVTEIQEASTYVGTEGFIAPEGPGTPGSDVYALGKVLYEACTGLDRKEFPALPDWWDESPEHADLLEFNEILIQACRAEPAKRYRTARELHAELLVLENGKSIRRLRLLEKRLTSLKRFGTIVALVTVGLGLVGYGAYQGWRRNIDARQRQVGGDVAYGNRAMEAGDFLQALPYFADSLRLDQGQPQQEKNDRLRVGALLSQCPKLTQMWFLPKELFAGQFSPDDRKVVVVEFFGQAHLFDIASGQPCSPPFGQDGMCDAVFSPDGSMVLTASEYGGVVLWDVATLKRLRGFQNPSRLYSARFSPDGSRVVTSGEDGRVRVWDVTGTPQKPLLTLNRHHGRVRSADFSHDGRLIVSGGEDGKAYLWEAATGRELGKALEHESWISCVAFSPDDQRVVTASDDHRVRVWDVASGKQVSSDLRHNDAAKGADFSPDGRLLVTADLGGDVHLWDAESLQPLEANPVLKQGERAIRVCFSHDSHRILVTCADGSARIWDLAGSLHAPQPVTGTYSRDGTCLLTRTHGTLQLWDALSGSARSPRIEAGALARQAELSDNGRYVVTFQPTNTAAGATNYLAQVWETSSGKALSPGMLLSHPVQGSALSRDGTRLVTFTGQEAQLWDTKAGIPAFAPFPQGEAVQGACFSPEGQRLALRGLYQVKVWDLKTGRLLFPGLAHPEPVSDVEFSPDGSRLATSCTDALFTKCFAQLWDAATGHPLGPRLNHGDGVLKATFSPDGSRLATASEDFTAMLWETATGQRHAPPLRHHHQVYAAVFSPDGQWVVTASMDKTARVWSAETGDPLTPPIRYPKGLDMARFLPDGRQFVTTSSDGAAWLWHLPEDTRPVEDLLKLAYLLSGGDGSASPRFTSSHSASMRAIWEQLRAKYPSDFCTSPQEVSEWDTLQAQENERSHHWSAAAFHLKRLLALHPEDHALADRLATAQQQK